MRKHLAALALLSAVAVPTAASAQATITEGSFVAPINGANDFLPELTGLGYTRYTTVGATISLATASYIDFYYLGSESGYADSFVSDADIVGELGYNNFAAPILLFTRSFAAGAIAPGSARAGFTSSVGAPAYLGDSGFGVFMTGLAGTQNVVDRFIIGYDDQITGPDDDNHDDLMVLAVVRAVPEPGTWATLLFGFGALGAAMRRKASKAPRFRASIA